MLADDRGNDLVIEPATPENQPSVSRQQALRTAATSFVSRRRGGNVSAPVQFRHGEAVSN